MRRAIDPKPGHSVIGVSLVLSRGRLVLVADTAVHDMAVMWTVASSQGTISPECHRYAGGDSWAEGEVDLVRVFFNAISWECLYR